MSVHTYRKLSDLPETLPVFPLPGAMLFPRWSLSLNIFEPRYLNMIDDAMSGHRLIGMVQSMGGSRTRPDLARVGCAGRITSYSETDDGRYMIVLTGISRFEVAELEVTTPYRQSRGIWQRYVADLSPPDITELPSRSDLIESLTDYVRRNDMKADWSAVEDAPIETLVNALCAGCPFSALEKQALLEAEGLSKRCGTLIALLQMDTPGGNGQGSLQ